MSRFDSVPPEQPRCVFDSHVSADVVPEDDSHAAEIFPSGGMAILNGDPHLDAVREAVHARASTDTERYRAEAASALQELTPERRDCGTIDEGPVWTLEVLAQEASELAHASATQDTWLAYLHADDLSRSEYARQIMDYVS